MQTLNEIYFRLESDKQLRTALSLFASTPVANGMLRSISWCQYTDLRDQVPPGSSAERFIGTIIGYHSKLQFAKACERAGWPQIVKIAKGVLN